MPTLLFADRDALRLALASGGLPSGLTHAPALAGEDPHGRLWLQPEAELPREAAAALGRLGVAVLGGDADVPLVPVACWPQLLPLVPAEFPPPSATPALFEVRANRLAQLVAEIRRAAPKSEFGFRLADLEAGSSHVLLHVERPPYLALLRARQEPDVAAYAEQACGVWVEIGFRHPLAEQISPPAGQLLFLTAPDRWSLRPEGPFEKESPTFTLPPGRTVDEIGDVRSIDAPFRLEDGGGAEPAELWVIHERPLEQLAGLAAESGAGFLSRFRVALVEPQGRTVILLWARPSKRQPPAPLLTALGCRPLLKLPNLFLPCGQRLTPPPRRDVLRRLAPDADRLVFLLPLGGGHWVPVGVPESAFAPLEDCVHHVVQTPPAAFVVSSPRHGLHWEPFEELDISVRPKVELRPPPAIARPTAQPKPKAVESGWLERLQGKLFASKKPAPAVKMKVGDAVRRALPEDAAPPPPDPTGRRPDLHERRSALEAKFLQTLDGRVTDAGLLPELAGLHSQLGNVGDAAICWLNAIWEADEPPEFWIWGWLQSEKKLSRVLFGENDLPRLVDATPSPSSVRLLAAAVTWNAKKSPDVLADQLGEFRLLLECHENWLPVRAAWLAHAALATVAGGDILALARTRDRLAGRLIQNGLSLELDVPSFVRFSGRDAGDRFQLVRDWLIKSRDLMHRWADQLTRNRPANYCRALPEEFPDRDGHCTKALIDLLLSWGLARLGERNAARQLAADARAQLAHAGDVVLNFLGEAFQFRINRALENAPSAGPLPPGLLAELERLRREPGGERQVLAPYRIDALRHLSRILEPTQHVNPYRPPMATGDAQPLDSATAVQEAEGVLTRVPVNLGEARRLLEAALESAGDALHDRLDDVVRLAERFPDPLPSVLLLAKAFEVAAARGDVTAAELLLPRLRRLFRGDGPRFGDLAGRLQQPSPPDDPRGTDAQRRLEALPGYCLRDLRRLGLTAEADALLLPAVEWVVHGKPLEMLRVTQPDTWPSALRAVLRLAGNWFADHNEERAARVLDTARKNLLYAPDLSPKERSALARSYAAALAHAPPRMTLGRFEEMFRDLGGLYEERQTNSHYALQPLALVDAVVRAALSDHFTLGSAVRRWLDADEFRVRQRLQRDLNAALEIGSLQARTSEL